MNLLSKWLEIDGFTSSNFFSEGEEPPDDAGIYVFADLETVFYIGKSVCLSRRVRYHEVALSGIPHTLWWKRSENLDSDERSLIRELRPSLNVQFNRRKCHV